jgi:glycosyltransferase involved in cell wall biosynthesis
VLDVDCRTGLRPVTKVVVAIPVKNEEERIADCLNAMLAQTRQADDVVLLLNDCSDATPAICREFRSRHSQFQIIECSLPDHVASAGEARRLALEYAAQLAAHDESGLLLTTDADSVAPPDWIERNCWEIRRGADVVCGRAEIDPGEAALIPARLREDHAREIACFELLDEIEALVSPEPADPWPRHRENSGASIAVTVAAFRAAGGAPRIACGEDRALIRNLVLTDAKIRHAPEISVRVSGRLQGRAAGGMAETLRNRIKIREIWCDSRIEPATDAYRRALAKAGTRAAWRGELPASALAQDLLCNPDSIRAALRGRYFGAAWARVEAISPVLKRRRVPVADLARETRQAALLRDQLRAHGVLAFGNSPAILQAND